ncbi:MAG TPA: gamma-glutamyltransferase, partial [Ilumatobacteraceae bacterium]|nr:gamma-glutamyltransferase [Ilumatobacteraceae bacterium]
IGASGGHEFYRGVVAKQIAAHIAARGGVLSFDDLDRHAGSWVDPLSVDYHGNTVFSNAPVSMGALLLACLQVVELRLAERPWGDAAAQIDELVRLKRVAFGTILPLLGDPAHVSFDDVLSPAATRAWSAAVDGDLPPAPDEGGTDTTSLAVAAADGSMVVFIHSLFNEFGSREYVPDAGIVLNDRLANLRRGEHPNALRAGCRPMHTLHAYLVDTAGGATIAGATPGGRGQVQTNLQVLLGVLDQGRDLQAAVDVPRWVHGMPRVAPDDQTLYLEPELIPLEPPLHALGCATEIVDAELHDHFGNCTIVGRDAEGTLSAASDHRRAGAAEAW